MGAGFTTRRVAIREEDGGWRMSHTGALFTSVLAAADSVHAEDRESGENRMTFLDWYPTSRVGRVVLKSLGIKS